jgi:hypothetical protein
MNTSVKANPNLRLALVPSAKGGMVHRYVKTDAGGAGSRDISAVAMPKTAALFSISDQQPGWLDKTGIDVHQYADPSRNINTLSEDEQSSVWMKTRTTVRSIESNYAANGLEFAKEFAARYDDTSLALAWDRLNLSEGRPGTADDIRQAVVDIIVSEVADRVDRGEFSPMMCEGYITVDAAPRSSVEF